MLYLHLRHGQKVSRLMHMFQHFLEEQTAELENSLQRVVDAVQHDFFEATKPTISSPRSLGCT